MDDAQREEIRKWLGWPDTHPTTRLVMAAHEAAHVVTAAVLAMPVARAWIKASVDVPSEDGVGGSMPLQLPNRFNIDELGMALSSAHPGVREAALTDLMALVRVLLAPYVLMEIHSLGERWTCIDDIVQSGRLLDLLPEDNRAWDESVAKNRILLNRLDVQYAMNALTAELLERSEVTSSDISQACKGLGPGVRNVGGVVVKTIFPDEEWRAMNRLAQARDVSSDVIFGEAVAAWRSAGSPDVDVPPSLVPVYAGKPEELEYYKAVRWWLHHKPAGAT